ncbi:hypothetical protein PRIPAC_70999 [Pristionchus pacificus]|uniref:Uncharacterized protein n=1 Tax=Pristionchus pacificus TaxID=54126 RepID=A0A454XR57_PRIPA|nr:hypothetical protein PRIPAC_70999 [Pristionchus pacificus]|eukprot:PDM81083.1 hypothetical protein PRIPAC_36086 [Pristionchus pacificus]
MNTVLLTSLILLISTTYCDDGLKFKLRKELNRKFDSMSETAKTVGVKINAVLDKNISRAEMEKEFDDLTEVVPEKIKLELEKARPTMNGKEITVDQFFEILEIH